MKTLIEIENEKRNLTTLDRLHYNGNAISFNGKTLLSETLVNCANGKHLVSAIICGHLLRGLSKKDILNSNEFAYLQQQYFSLNIEWFFVLGGREAEEN